MISKKHVAYGAIITTLAVAMATYAATHADSSGKNDAAAASQALITLVQAVGLAEQHTHGKAVRAELEQENGNAVYEVEIFDGQQALDVKVDSRDGRILSAQPDKADTDNDEDHQD